MTMRDPSPSQVEIAADVRAMHAGSVTIPGAIVIALISAAATIAVGYLARPGPSVAQLPANAATAADIRDVREDLRQLRAEFRAAMANIDARQGQAGPPAAARP